MRNCIPVLFLATPAWAHPSDLPHAHSADWTVPVALLLIGIAAVAARRRTARARK